MYDKSLVIEILTQIENAIKITLQRFEIVDSVDYFTNTPQGMEKLDSICMQLIAIGESLKNIDKITRSTHEHNLFCIVEKVANVTFKELVSVENRFLILVFENQEVVLKYNTKVEQFLNTLVGCSMRELEDISAQVGLYELHDKLSAIFSKAPILKEGEKEMYAIAKELRNDAFIDRFQKLHFLESLQDGVYFDGFVPRGCMAIKQKAHIKDNGASVELFCFGRIESDFESFFNKVKE